MDHSAGVDVSVKETSVCIVDRQDRARSKSGERTRSSAAGAEKPCLSLQANWTGSRAAVAMALQRACRSGFAGDLCRDGAHAGGAGGADQQDRPQRCTRDCADDAGGALSSGACEDVTQPETADAADASQAALQSAWTAKGPGTPSYLTLRQSRLRAWSASAGAGAARRHPIRLARYTQAGRFLRSHVMALAQLVAAVIDNLTLTNWGSHKNKSAFRPLFGYQRRTLAADALIASSYLAGVNT